MTKAPIATPGVSRQIRPNTIPKIPRKPTAHQLSARTSLSASQRSLVAAGLLFPDPVLAAMGEPPSIALQRQDIVGLTSRHVANMPPSQREKLAKSKLSTRERARGRVRPLPQPRKWFAAARYGRDRDRSSHATAERRPDSAIRPARDWSQAERLRRNSAQAGVAWS